MTSSSSESLPDDLDRRQKRRKRKKVKPLAVHFTSGAILDITKDEPEFISVDISSGDHGAITSDKSKIARHGAPVPRAYGLVQIDNSDDSVGTLSCSSKSPPEGNISLISKQFTELSKQKDEKQSTLDAFDEKILIKVDKPHKIDDNKQLFNKSESSIIGSNIKSDYKSEEIKNDQVLDAKKKDIVNNGSVFVMKGNRKSESYKQNDNEKIIDEQQVNIVNIDSCGGGSNNSNVGDGDDNDNKDDNIIKTKKDKLHLTDKIKEELSSDVESKNKILVSDDKTNKKSVKETEKKITIDKHGLKREIHLIDKEKKYNNKKNIGKVKSISKHKMAPSKKENIQKHKDNIVKQEIKNNVRNDDNLIQLEDTDETKETSFSEILEKSEKLEDKEEKKPMDKLPLKSDENNLSKKIIDKSSDINKANETLITDAKISEKNLGKPYDKVLIKKASDKISMEKSMDKKSPSSEKSSNNKLPSKEKPLEETARDKIEEKDQEKPSDKALMISDKSFTEKIADKALRTDETSKMMDEVAEKLMERVTDKLSSSKSSEDISETKPSDKNAIQQRKQSKFGDELLRSSRVHSLNKIMLSPSEKLIMLCKKGDWLAVDTLLRQSDSSSFDVNIVSAGNLWNPVMYAAKDNRVNIINSLVDVGYQVNHRAQDGITALHLACTHAREDTIRILLSRKADPLIAGGPKNQLPIHLIAQKQTGAAVAPLQLLLKSSPKDMRLIPDKDGNIPLLLSADIGNHGVCRELLTAFEKQQLDYQRPGTLETGLHIATRRKDMDMMRLMVECGANVNLRNKEGQTPLHMVAADGNELFVRFFYATGANPNIGDKEERTPLHLATENGHTKVVDVLTEKFKASLTVRTKDGNTLMHIASKAGQPLTALNFMKKGVPLHMPNKDGAKAIHMAAYSGQVDVVKQALARGEHVDVMTNTGLTPLHIAVEAGQAEVVECLLGHGANVHIKTMSTQETPLHIASRIESGKTCTTLLIKSGSRVNDVDQNGETALYYCGRYGLLDTFILLLENNCNFIHSNKMGENILHITVKQCNFRITQYLIQYIFTKYNHEQATQLINQQNMLGESSVHYAGLITSEKLHEPNEDRDLIRLLLQTGGDVFLGTNQTQETPVHYCSKSGNTNVLKEIIKQLSPIDAQIICNKQDKNGWSPLLYACNAGHPEIIKILLTQNARVDIFDERGRAGLHLAAELGREDVVDLLLANNAFVNVRNKTGMTPLHLASKNGFNNMVTHLITQYNAHLDAMTLNKQTPLHLAAEYGQLEVSRTLLDMKADINAMDNQSQTPLHLAAQSDHPQVLRLFLEHRPELVSVPNKNGFTCAHIAATKGSVAVLKELMRFNQEVVKSARVKKTGSTTLHMAAEGGHVKVVKLLLQAGAKASDENLEGMTPLHLAAKAGHVGVLDALKGAVDWSISSHKTGFTALHVAAMYGQVEFVSEMLTIVPAGITSKLPIGQPHSDYEITPLHLAAQNGHESVVRLLMNSTGVQVDTPTKLFGSIPMHLAAQGGHLVVAGLLISRSSDSLFKRDSQGRTCVHLAAAHGHKDMVALLLGQGAQINTQDKKGWSPLHLAARNGFLQVVQLLIESGADPLAITKQGKVPICCAAAAGHYQVLSYLLKKDHDSHQLMDDKTFLMDLMTCSKNHDNKPIREFILVSHAPIDTAVKLARQFEIMALREKERARDLESASAYCDNLSIDLLSIAATTNNAGSLLRATDIKNTEFLDVLIELDRKELVAQHAVQKYLTEIWIGSLTLSTIQFILLFIVSIFPPVWIAISTPIGHSLHQIPIIKFMSYLISHIFFIALLVYTTVFPSKPLYLYDNAFPLWNEWLLFIWLIGILVSDMTNPSDRSGLGSIKICVLLIGFIAVGVHLIVAVLDIIYDRNDIIMGKIWSTRRLDTLYTRNQLLAFSMLLSFIEFLNFLTFHPLFGPWGVIIQELIQDLLRYLAILSIFLTGFTLHICAIYQPVYNPPTNWNFTSLPIGQDFLQPDKSFEMLFYALFGLVEPDTMPPMHLSPYFAKMIMKIVFGVYMMVTVIVLINLLIAMMSNTYQRIESQSDIEWKFGRAKLIRNMNRTLSTPAPINLIIGLPILMCRKTKNRCCQRRSEMRLAKKAFGHLSEQRPSIIAAKQLLNRRASHISRNTQSTGLIGGSIEDGITTSKPIDKVVNWSLIVNKYYEFIGEDHEIEHANSQQN